MQSTLIENMKIKECETNQLKLDGEVQETRSKADLGLYELIKSLLDINEKKN